MLWTIKCYVAENGKSDVQEVYDRATDDVKAGLEVELEYLTVRSREEWRRPHAHKLSNCKDFRDFFEIRFKADRLQQRPIGYFGPGKNEFTILLWATEKGNALVPKDWCKSANGRRKRIVEGTASVRRLKLDEDDDAEV